MNRRIVLITIGTGTSDLTFLPTHGVNGLLFIKNQKKMDIVNKMDGSAAYKVIDADKEIVLQMFHEDHRQKMLNYYSGLSVYKCVSEDIDKDIICSRYTTDNEYEW